MRFIQILNIRISLDYFLIFGVIYFSSSFLFISLPGVYSIIGFLIILLIKILTINFSNLKIMKSFITFFLFTVVYVLFVFSFTDLFFNPDIDQYVIFIILLFLALTYSAIVTFENFVRIFINIMIIFSVISLLLFVVHKIFPGFFLIFPIYQNSTGLIVHNLLIFFEPIPTINRNFGFFWEPGAFAFFLSIALFFMIQRRYSFFRMLIIIISILSTFSTAGYINLILLLFFFIFINFHRFYSSGFEILLKRFFIIGTLGIVVLTISNYYFSYELSWVFDKLLILFDSDLTNPSFSTTTVRLNSFINAFNIIINNPLIGVGYNSFYFSSQNVFVQNLVTFLNWIMIFGLPFGLFYIFSYTSIFYNKEYNIFLNIFVIFIQLIFISSQDLHRNMFILILLYHGFNKFINLRIKL